MTMEELELRYLATNGIALHAAVAGAEDGTPVLLLHGFPELWSAWSGYIERLAAEGFRVIAPDQRGYNLSDKPAGLKSYALDELAKDIVGLIDGAGKKKARIVGHDWGAAVTWWTAMTFPDRVEQMVALNVPHPIVMRGFLLGGNLKQIAKSWYMFFFQLPFIPEAGFRRNGGRTMFRRMTKIGRPGAFDDHLKEECLLAWQRPGATTAMINWYRAAIRQGLQAPPENLRIQPPALVIWGKQDNLLEHSMVAPSLELCDDGRVEWFEDATHWVNHEESDRVQEVLLDFFRPIDKRAVRAG